MSELSEKIDRLVEEVAATEKGYAGAKAARDTLLAEIKSAVEDLERRAVPEGWMPQDIIGPRGVHVILAGSEGYRVTGSMKVRLGRDLGLIGRHWDGWREAIAAAEAARKEQAT